MITTDLFFAPPNGESKRIGGGQVPVFVDDQSFEIWIATNSPRRVAIELARTIDRLLGEFQGVNLAALEDMLRVSSTAEIADVLNDRRVADMREVGEREFTWTAEHDPRDATIDIETDATNGVQDVDDTDQHRPSERAPSADHGSTSPEPIVRQLVANLNKVTSSRSQNSEDVDTRAGRAKGSDSQVELPPLDEVNLVIVQQSEATVLAAAGAARSGRAGGSPNWSPRSGREVERDKLIGDRGEELVYRHELERLRKLGYAKPEDHVLWTSRNDPGADHDIKSISEDGRPLWIEVKSTTGTDGRFEWTQSEFKKALADGDHYELWRVYEANTEQPTAKCFRNPITLLKCSALLLELGTLRAIVEPLD